MPHIQNFNSILKKRDTLNENEDNDFLKEVIASFIQSEEADDVNSVDGNFDIDYMYNGSDSSKCILNIIGDINKGSIMGIFCDHIGDGNSSDVIGSDNCKVFLGDSFQEILNKVSKYIG